MPAILNAHATHVLSAGRDHDAAEVRVYESADEGGKAIVAVRDDKGATLAWVRINTVEAKRLGDALVEWAEERLAGITRE